MLVVVGEALVDMVPTRCDGVRHFAPRPGGSPYNVAVGAARLDVPAAFLGRLSTDPFGRMLRDHLATGGVSVEHVVDSADPTALAFVHPDERGVAEYSFYMTGTAERQLVVSDVASDLRPTMLHVGSIALVLEPIATTVDVLVERFAGDSVVTLDPNVRPQFIPDREDYRARLARLLPHVDIVKVSDDDLGWLEPGQDPLDLAGGWLDHGPRLVIVTRGAEGAVALTPGGTVAVAARPVAVADTVGAGDSFMAATLAWVAEHRDALDGALGDRVMLADLLHRAVAAAAITCGRPGADPPSRAELDAALGAAASGGDARTMPSAEAGDRGRTSSGDRP